MDAIGRLRVVVRHFRNTGHTKGGTFGHFRQAFNTIKKVDSNPKHEAHANKVVSDALAAGGNDSTGLKDVLVEQLYKTENVYKTREDHVVELPSTDPKKWTAGVIRNLS
ncbi:hypothetical protein ERJ75_001587600 [Trypanosoma vivax]|nr:hypothetical protein ERJ75_001587600 [Trypanosoma vivax]